LEIRVAGEDLSDLAVLELGEPVPAGVTAAQLRCPKPVDVIGRAWWSFGFPDRDPIGNSAHGVIGASLGYGWVRLDAESRYSVKPGFSGGGLWSADYGAVIGIVGAANDRGDGRAITLHQADQCLPGEQLKALSGWKVEEAGELALSSWGWSLREDPESSRHWRPRSRGVSVDAERGFRFQGRRKALTEIVAWLGREGVVDRKVLIVTGSPGVGKSAVLGRVVTTADADIAASLPPEDKAVRALVGSIACAVHAKGKTAFDVAAEISRAASAALPERLEDLAQGMFDALAERGGQRFNVVIDALDEAASPGEARSILAHVVLPIAEICADVGAQVVIGTRRRDDAGDLLRSLGPAQAEVDLDTAEYFSITDLTAYALATLQLRGSERPGSPYASDSVARPVAARIAALAGQNFLVAGLIARTHGLHDEEPADPGQITFTATVETALQTYIDRLPGLDGIPAIDILSALAFAEAPGFTTELWQIALHALDGRTVPAERLNRFVRGSAANFLIAASEEGPASTFRLYHQALADALLMARAQVVPARDDERSLVRAFYEYGTRLGWDRAPVYLLRSLPGHASRADLVDELLADDEYLLRADLRRLIPASDGAATSSGQSRARLLRLTPRAIGANPQERAALFSVTETLESLGSAFRDRPSQRPYQALWASVAPRTEWAVLEGHAGINALCSCQVNGRTLLASGGDEGTVRIWDVATGEVQDVRQDHTGAVNALCAVEIGGRILLASGGHDRTVRIWDPVTGATRHVLQAHKGAVNALCSVQVDGQPLLVSGGRDGRARLWDPSTGELRRTLKVLGKVNALCPVEVEGRVLLASGGDDRYTVRLWDPSTGAPRGVLDGSLLIRTLCQINVNGRPLLAGGGNYNAALIWDPATGELEQVLATRTVNTLCSIEIDDQTLLVGCFDDGALETYNPATGEARRIKGSHSGAGNTLCRVQIGGRVLVASGGDHTVRIWDPAVGDRQLVEDGYTAVAGTGEVNALCSVEVGKRTLLASGGKDRTVRVWDPAAGELQYALEGHTKEISALCSVEVGGRILLTSGNDDHTVRVWDPVTGRFERALEILGMVSALCPVEIGGRILLAVGSNSYSKGKLQIWDPSTGEFERTLSDRTGPSSTADTVNALCPVEIDGRPLLASGDGGGTVRIWDLATGESLRDFRLPYYSIRALCPINVHGRIMLAASKAAALGAVSWAEWPDLAGVALLPDGPV
jgi:WD40 repeat protein